MNFSKAWAKLARENVLYRWIAIGKLALILFLCTILFLDSAKDPIVIDICGYKKLNTVKGARSQIEIKHFLRESLEMRFNTDVIAKSRFVSDAELKAKELELGELSKNKITQKIVVDSIIFNEEKIIVSADRLVSTKDIRSVLPVLLQVEISELERSMDNPYGLILTNTNVIEIKKEKNQ